MCKLCLCCILKPHTLSPLTLHTLILSHPHTLISSPLTPHTPHTPHTLIPSYPHPSYPCSVYTQCVASLTGGSESQERVAMVFADGVDKMVELYVPYCKNKTASEDLVASHRTYLSVCLVMSGYVWLCL